jgi:hypothetical protein
MLEISQRLLNETASKMPKEYMNSMTPGYNT